MKRKPWPPRLAALAREAWWLVLLLGALYLALVLVTYDKSDPGWSLSTGGEHVHNAGGQFGARLADVLLYLFGLSAYWCIVLLLFAILWGYRRLDARVPGDRRSLVVAGLGFLSLLLASASLEAMRLHALHAQLPLTPGGVLGKSIAHLFSRWFGPTGGALTLLFIGGIGLSLFSGLSWLDVSEKLGEWIERGWSAALARWDAARDRKLGERAAYRREEMVEEDKRKLDEHEPLRIEQVQLEIPRSARVAREKQKPLFEDLPDSPLPPLHLLEESRGDVQILSADTLEYTSRLIEKKLLDFGIEVRVVAAQPGPVITRYEIEPAVGVKGSQIVNLVKD
ncbi:MAG TPA: DNA translocase FtsK 4TM domain-containing protein, partial [Burkholderiales bacterium]|nr:DNA translocase FtsK 4TM domain-containing protein [Burkholderiales bacterium]